MALINKKGIPPTVSFKDSMQKVTSGMTEQQFREKYDKEIADLVKNMDNLTDEKLDKLGVLQDIRTDKTIAKEKSDDQNYFSSSLNKNVTSTGDGYGMPWLMGGITGAAGAYGASKLILPDGSFTLPRKGGLFPYQMYKTATRLKGLTSYKGHQNRVASEFAKSVANQLNNSFAESGKSPLVTQEQYKGIVRNVKENVETNLKAKTGGMKNTYKISDNAVRKAFNKNNITIGPEVSPGEMGTTPKTPSSGGKKGVNKLTIGKNVSIENPGNAQLPQGKKQLRLPASTYKPDWTSKNLRIVLQNVSKLINSPKPKLDLKSGVGALAALALNDQFGEFRENPDRSFVENVSGGIESTAKGFKPSSVIGGLSGIFNAMGEVSENLPMGKGELLSKGFKVIGGGLGKASEWVDDKERSVFDPVGHEYDRRREEADKGYGVIGQTRSDFRKEYWGEKEPPLGSAVTGMDLFNVGTKGMSTKKGVESFDKMLVDLGYNPNELTTKQKVSMMKRGKGLIQKK